jgi:23S rRNA pseudouridine1911/1915/1917 synthase
MRLDVFLQQELRNTSRTRARAIIENSAFNAEGKRLRASERVRGEDRVFLWRPAFEKDDADVELPVLYEDEHLLVVDKPPLIAVHPTARHHNNTVLKVLERQRPGEFFSLLHRLDRETSGVLMLGRTAEADRAFKRSIEDRSLAESRGAAPVEDGGIHKTYLAIVRGIPDRTLIDAPLEIDPVSSLRVKVRVARPGAGQVARTGVDVLERRGGYALLTCRLLTGRQHQIRVHLAHIGCPVVGDKLYGPDERLLARAADQELTEEDALLLELPRHALHAERYELRHALTGAPLSFRAPLAADLSAFWNGLDR